MRTIVFSIVLALSIQGVFPQNNSLLKFIFVPHPRSENKDPQNVLPVIEKIDYSLYDMILLGGDLTWSVSTNVKWMNYCNAIFDLGNPNTLWTLGNHDTNNRTIISSFTGRPTSYAYFRKGVTFVVLDTEISSGGFQNTFIHGEQLTMLQNVCDTISASGCLVVLHHRLLWMINNGYFSTKIDSVGESTRQLDTTNFYQDVFPLLKTVASKGIKVYCLGGDKSKIIINYSPEENIHFLTSPMAPEYPDSLNKVITFDFDPDSYSLNYEFIPLNKIKVKDPVSVLSPSEGNGQNHLLFTKTGGYREYLISLSGTYSGNASLTVYSINGGAIKTLSLPANHEQALQLSNDGVFIIRAVLNDQVFSQIFVAF